MAKTPKRSTLDVAKVKQEANDMLLNSGDDYQQGRQAVSLFLENLLLQSGNYNGFKYLTKTDMQQSKQGKTVGIHEEHIDHGSREQKFNGTDSSRRRYY